MLIEDVIQSLEDLAPLKFAEDFDNVGLLVGNGKTELKGILVTLDTLEEVVEEAIAKNCNLIVSFHPIIFSGLKRISGKTYVEKAVIKAIKNDIAIYAIHTALDNSNVGVNKIICDQLNIKDTQILLPKKETIKKLVTYVPNDQAVMLKKALFKAGAGNIGNYEECSFSTKGIGSFKGNEESNPNIGSKHKYHEEPETMVSVTYSTHLEGKILSALFDSHPYEEVAYEITTLENNNQNLGMGMIGNLEDSMDTQDFLLFVKQKMNCGIIRHSLPHTDSVKRVAVLGGSGAFAINAAKAQKADIFLSSDFKYHNFFEAENQIILADIGHYESEQYTKNFLTDYLSKKFTNFAVLLSTTNTNPVKYF